jgi:RNA polymerase sigma-70 factor (ECF subfamily)
MSELYRLVEQEIPRLRRYARALTRATDRADDLVQDTLVRALTKLHLWQPGTDLRAWLFTIMHHQYVNTVRREARERATVDIEQVSSSLAATTDPTAQRQLLELDRALARLPSEQREVVLLVGLEGMPYESVAEILGVPIGTVRSRLSRGRERLRELMGRDREPQQPSDLANTDATADRCSKRGCLDVDDDKPTRQAPRACASPIARDGRGRRGGRGSSSFDEAAGH